MARGFLSAFENDSGNSGLNGEYDVLDRLVDQSPRFVIDVGANVGSWTLAAAERFTTATIHAFEPAPSNLYELRRNIGDSDRIVIHAAALGTKAGSRSLHFNPEHPTMASLSDRNTQSGRTFEVEVLRGDDFLVDAGVAVVDFLKIDAEGSDLDVLLGFGGALSEGRIRVAQFEFGMWQAIEQNWLKDFVDVLAGYRLGRIFPGHVEPLDYRAEQEQFHYRANFVAVREDDVALVERVFNVPGN